MGHRTVKRVPMDFDAPLKEVWEGYKTPPEFCFPACPTCGPSSRHGGGGDGLTPEARAVEEAFYAFGAEHLAWASKLGQAEVDHLWEEGRLTRWNRETRKHDKGESPPSAEEVNAANRGASMLGDYNHDAINRWILTKFRCERLGIQVKCPTCEGHGDISTAEQRKASEEWEAPEPPGGDGWQLWETTSEGSPVSPVFASAEELADWCAENASAFASMTMTAAEWLASFEAGTTDVDTLLVVKA